MPAGRPPQPQQPHLFPARGRGLPRRPRARRRERALPARAAARRLPHLRRREDAFRRSGGDQGLHHRDAGARPARRFRPADRPDRARRGRAAAPCAATYYAGEGADDPVRIAIPLGSYVAGFEPGAGAVQMVAAADGADGAEDAGEGAPAIRASAPRSERRRAWWIGAAAAVAIVAASSAALYGVGGLAPDNALPARAAALPNDGRPIVVVQPLRTIGQMPESFSPAVVRSILIDALAQFDGLTILENDPDRAVGREHYELKLRAAPLGEKVHMTVRLVHQPGGQLVWSRELDARLELGHGGAERDMARAIGVAIGQPYGVIFSDLRARAPAGSPAECLIRAHDTRFRVSRADHPLARDCLEAVVAANPSYHLGYRLLPHGAQRRPQPASGPARSGAARRKTRGRARAAERPRSFRDDERALRAPRHRGGAQGRPSVDCPEPVQLGSRRRARRYIRLGRYPEGLALLDRAIEDNPGRPPWYDFHKFVAAYMTGDLATACAVSETFVGDKYLYGPLARGLVAHLDGDEARAKVFLDQVSAAVPQLTRDPRAAFQRYGFGPTITDRFVADLGAAGLRAGTSVE